MSSAPDMHAQDVAHGEGHDHPTAGFYWFIGIVLTIITAVEVAIFYVPALESVLVPILLILSAGKFVLVVAYYMHLKVDSPIFTGVFLAGFALAAFMVTALTALYHWLPAYGTVPS